jgi:TPR repeat protein
MPEACGAQTLIIQVEATRLFGLAAAQGNARAQFNLGVMYFKGEGATKDNIYAHMWVNIAASSGDADGVKVREIIAKRMTTEDILKAIALARECMQKNFKGC